MVRGFDGSRVRGFDHVGVRSFDCFEVRSFFPFRANGIKGNRKIPWYKDSAGKLDHGKEMKMKPV